MSNLKVNMLMHWFLLLVGLAVLLPARAGDGDRARPRHRLAYFQLADSTAYLQSYLYVSEKGERTDVDGAEIEFFVLTDTSETLVAKAVTDAKGIARGIITDITKFWSDSLGTVNFAAVFDGNELFEGRDADVTVKALELSVEFAEEDSVRSVEIRAVNPVTGERLEDIEVKIYVERMFRPLNIGSASTGRRGTGSMEFPSDIPGDENGGLDVIVKMEDNDDYGNFILTRNVDWGVRLEPLPHKIQRALWSPLAPLWMVLVFLVLMVTVWGHYAVIAYLLNRMRSYRQGRAMIWE